MDTELCRALEGLFVGDAPAAAPSSPATTKVADVAVVADVTPGGASTASAPPPPAPTEAAAEHGAEDNKHCHGFQEEGAVGTDAAGGSTAQGTGDDDDNDDNDDGTVWEVEAGDVRPLRDYQSVLVRRLKKLMRRHLRGSDGSSKSTSASALLHLPTGGGKTRVACELIRWCVSRRRRCVFVVNRNKLADQAVCSLGAAGLRLATGVLKAGHREEPWCPVQVTSIQSLRSDKRPYPPASLVVIDEAHCAVAPSYLAMCRHYQTTGAFVLGLTATPMRLDPTESLSAVFDRTARGPTVSQLVHAGVLVPPVVYSLDHVEVTKALAALRRERRGKARALAADDAASEPMDEAAALLATQRMVRHAVQAWRARAEGKRTIAFCTTIEHSRLLEAAFSKQGVQARHIDGSTPEREREALFDAFADGEVTVLTSVNVLTEGFDQPGIEAVMLLRPTQSRALYVQMVGRGLRQHPGKSHCVVLDQSGNTASHGPVTTPATAAAVGDSHAFCTTCGLVMFPAASHKPAVVVCTACRPPAAGQPQAATARGRGRPLADVTNKPPTSAAARKPTATAPHKHTLGSTSAKGGASSGGTGGGASGGAGAGARDATAARPSNTTLRGKGSVTVSVVVPRRKPRA